MTTGVDPRAAVRAALLAEAAAVADRLADLGAELDGIVDAAAACPPDDEHDAEGTTVGFERARIAALLAHERGRLAAVEAALARAAGEDPTRCAACGRPIPPERLEALPTTRWCVACVPTAGAGRVPGVGRRRAGRAGG